MKLDPWKRLQIRFMWALLHLVRELARKQFGITGVESPPMRDLQEDLRTLKDQE